MPRCCFIQSTMYWKALCGMANVRTASGTCWLAFRCQRQQKNEMQK